MSLCRFYQNDLAVGFCLHHQHGFIADGQAVAGFSQYAVHANTAFSGNQVGMMPRFERVLGALALIKGCRHHSFVVMNR